MSVVLLAETIVAVPVPGYGYIAGEAPTGIVSIDNVPGTAIIDLLTRSDHKWVRRQVSAGDGTYRFTGLPLGVQYDLIGIDVAAVWGDVIVSRIEPYAAPQVTTSSLAFSVGTPATTQMASQYGTGPMLWSADTTPPGLSLSATGKWTGTATTPGTYVVTVTVTDIYGESSTRTFTVVVT